MPLGDRPVRGIHECQISRLHDAAPCVGHQQPGLDPDRLVVGVGVGAGSDFGEHAEQGGDHPGFVGGDPPQLSARQVEVIGEVVVGDENPWGA